MSNPDKAAKENEVFAGKVEFQGKEIPLAQIFTYGGIEKALRLMIQEWNLETPKIVLFLVSDYEDSTSWSDFNLNKAFVKGLIKACNSTSMWIFTNGLNMGISKVIGDAFHVDYSNRYAQLSYYRLSQKISIERTPLIGVCYDYILTYAENFKILESNLQLEKEGTILEEHKYDLNPYHTHYLILKKDVKLLRTLTKLEEGFKGISIAANGEEPWKWPTSPVPSIVIIFQGSLKDVEFILSHLKRKLPVLIIKGSGGLADILAYAYYEVRRSFLKINDMEYVENVLKQSLSNEISAEFPQMRENKHAHSIACRNILDSIKYAEPPDFKYITIFNMRDRSCDADDLPNHLLDTILKSQKYDVSEHKEQLKRDLQLTIDFNCPELAETKVFFKDPNFFVSHDVFEQTLLQEGREKFISMFLELGFDVHKYTNSSRVIKLFERALSEHFFKKVCWEGVLGYKKIMMLQEDFIDLDLNWIIESLNGIPIYLSSQELDNHSMGKYPSDCSLNVAISIARRKSMIVLIIWALLTNRRKLSLYLWRHIDRPIITALACSMILKNMQMHVKDKIIIEEIQELSSQFADMALGVFDLCYNDMPSKAYKSLCVKSKEWGSHSISAMAAFAYNKNLVAHSCCQKFLTNTFLGNIKIIDLPHGFLTFPIYLKVILCAFLIFPMYWWVRFKDPSSQEFSDTKEYEMTESYYLPSDFKEKKQKASPTDMGRTNLLKYTYPPLNEMIYSMWSAPITKFWVSLIFYVIYLTIFSIAVIWPSCGNFYLDLLVCIWTFLIAIESAHRLYFLKQVHPTTELFSSVLEIVYILLFAFAVAALRIGPNKDPYGGKVVMCIGLIFFYYRMIFTYLPISPTLGPLLLRVKEMVSVDFVNFMKFVFLILIANAIAMQAILYPDYPLCYEMFRMAFHKAFISFFRTPTNELTGTEGDCVQYEQSPNDEVMCRVSEYIDGTCSSGTYFWPYVIVFHYMLLLKLVLLTILFALFHNTGARIGPESNILWKHQRYHLVEKFSVSMRLPPPLNIISLLLLLLHSICQFLLKCFKKDYAKKPTPENYKGFSSFEYNYWKQLAQVYISKNKVFEDEEEFIEREVEIIDGMLADVNMKKDMLFRTKSQIAQLEADFNYTQAHLETLKYREKKEEEKKIGFTLHKLSRESPYPGTNIQRFPVPDKYVPWEVLWLHYDPSNFSVTKAQLHIQVRPYADEHVIITQKVDDDYNENEESDVPFQWNRDSTDKCGVYKNRHSWCLDIKGNPLRIQLNDGFPCNPMGRTGLKGRGFLPRWGPNHNVFVVITKQRQNAHGSEHSLFSSSFRVNTLEIVKCRLSVKMGYSLPGGYSWFECRYIGIQNIFQCSDPAWETSDDMIEFFRRFSSSSLQTKDLDDQDDDSFKYKKLYCGYMDDELNTDNAWKEVELWHIHYDEGTNIESAFKLHTKWNILSDDFFLHLPSGQTTLLQYVIRSMET